MLFELTLIAASGDGHLADGLAEALTIIHDSGLPYQLTPSATCIEGSWEEVMPVVQRCHQRLRAISPHVFTRISVEDHEGVGDHLHRNLDAVAAKSERPLATAPR